MKRATTFGLIASLLAALGTLATPTAQSASQMSLRFWHACSLPVINQTLKDRADAFSKKFNVAVTVECFPFSEYFQKITTATAGGNAPEVFWVDFPLIADYAYRKTIIPLDKYVSKEDLADYYPTPRDNMEKDGHIWALPMHQSTEAMVYNAQLLAQASITAPRTLRDAWTWTQFRDVARKLTRVSGGRTEVWGYTTHYDPGLYSIQPFITQHNGSILSPDGKRATGYLNGAAAVEAMTFWGRLFTTDKVSPVERIPDIFQTGKVALYQANPFLLRDLQQRYPNLEVGVTFLPKDKQCAVPSGAYHIGIHSQAKDPDFAWKFVDWMAGKEGHEIWSEKTGYLPARKSAYAALSYLKQYPWNIFWEGLVNCAVARPKTPGFTFLDDRFNDVVRDIQLGKAPKAVLDEAAAKVDAELTKYP